MRTLVPLLGLCAFTWASHAEIIAQWSFNSVPPDSNTGTGTTNTSVGNGTARLIGGTTATFATGGTNDPATGTDDSGWNTASYPAQNAGNQTAGVQFNVSTLGYSDIVVRWDQKVSGSASKYYRLLYSSDGVAFTPYLTPLTMQQVVSTGSYFENQTNTLAAVLAVADNPDFAFRIVSEFEDSATGGGTNGYVTTEGANYGSGGTVRFDLVTVSGTPIPGANTAPTLSTVSNQTLRVNHSSSALPLLLADAEDPPDNLVLAKHSSDPSVIPVANIVFGGTGAARTVTVDAAGQTGTSTITLSVIDTGGRSNSVSFMVTVLLENTLPVISSFAPANTLINTVTAPITFQVYDLETASSDLTVQASSANQALLPDANIQFGGSGTNRTVTLTPAPGQSGVAPLSVTVSDGTNTATTPFALMVTPAGLVFYEPFAYANGSLLTNSGFLWDNRSGIIGQCEVTNSQLLVVGSTGEDVVGALAGGPYARSNNYVLYAAFRAKFLTLPKAAPGYFAHFVSGSSLRGRVYAGTTNATPGSFQLAVANGSDTVAPVPIDLSTNTTYTVVTRYAVDSPTTTLWVNPLSEADPGVTAVDPQGPLSISGYGFRQDATLGATVLIDDLKIGLSFAAVTANTATNNPVPLGSALLSGKLVLSWNAAGFALQAAGAVNGPYTNIPGAVSPYTNPITATTRFFRLKLGD
jgi:hypothetical protein